MIVTARVERDGDTNYFLVRLNYDGPVVLEGESYNICSDVAYKLTHPEEWEPTETQEVADAIRKEHDA